MSSIGKRRFDIEGPCLWNSLSKGLRRVGKMKDFGKGLYTNFSKEY